MMAVGQKEKTMMLNSVGAEITVLNTGGIYVILFKGRPVGTSLEFG